MADNHSLHSWWDRISCIKNPNVMPNKATPLTLFVRVPFRFTQTGGHCPLLKSSSSSSVPCQGPAEVEK